MQVADKTVEFVKQWINGLYTKRQYQNYYIVKTDHAEFLMKLTERRELLATKDTTKHVYIWDENGDEDNAFSMLLQQPAFVWPNGFSRVSSGRIGNNRYGAPSEATSPVNMISKFRVCERTDFPHVDQPLKTMHMTLFALGERRFVCIPDREEVTKTQALVEWADFCIEKKYPYRGGYPNNSTVVETIPHIEKLSQMRQHYVDLAGEVAGISSVVDKAWIYIPTPYQTVDEIAGTPLSEMRKSRPNPFSFGINPAHFDIKELYNRYETSEENLDQLVRCFKDTRRHGLVAADENWRGHLLSRYPSDLAKDYIAYIEADDAWLKDNSEAAVAYAAESMLRKHVGECDGYLYAAKELDSRLGKFAIYVKTKDEPFVRIVPTPELLNRLYNSRNDTYGY